MIKVMPCSFEVNEFEHQSCYYDHFPIDILGKGMNTLISPAMSRIVRMPLFYKDDFGIKQLTKFDKPVSKETKNYFLNSSSYLFSFPSS